MDDDLIELTARALDHSLDGLEAAIWAGVALRAQNRTVAKRRVSFQSGVMALAIVGSIALGVHATRVARAIPARALFAFGLELAPSSLLLGNVR